MDPMQKMGCNQVSKKTKISNLLNTDDEIEIKWTYGSSKRLAVIRNKDNQNQNVAIKTKV